MNTPQDIAQAMLDRYGFFVVCSSRPKKVPSVREVTIGAGRFRPSIPGKISAKIKLVAKATDEDFAKQCALAGVEDKPGPFMYRAVAE